MQKKTKYGMKWAFVKVGMTTIFADNGLAQGVTVLKMQPAQIIRHEKLQNNSTLIVVEYDIGNYKKISRGWMVENPDDFIIGDFLKSPELQAGQKIKITGLSKGRGFQDAMTVHGFHGGPASHGSRFHRAPGSVGMRTEPGRVMKGKKMPKHDGWSQSTRNAKVVASKDDLLAVLGGVPGSVNSIVFI